jgi:hypothetical protein
MRLRDILFIWFVYVMLYSVGFVLLFTLLAITAEWLGIRSRPPADLIGLGKWGLMFGFFIGTGIWWADVSERKKRAIHEPKRPRRW